MKRYPVQRSPTRQQNNSVVPVARGTTQIPAIPTTFNVLANGSRFADHNVCGQVLTRIDLQDRNGNKMTIHQRQQVLNLVNGARGNWYVHDGINRNPTRRKKHGNR